MKLALALLPLLLIGCGHHRDVRPGPKGIHRVVVTSEDAHAGQRDALRQANHFCDQSKKKAAIHKEGSRYTGDVSESTYKTAKAISRAARSAGTQTQLNGSRREANRGQIATGTANSLDSAMGNGYTTEMTFSCI
jgi:hypothetical protein